MSRKVDAWDILLGKQTKTASSSDEFEFTATAGEVEEVDTEDGLAFTARAEVDEVYEYLGDGSFESSFVASALDTSMGERKLDQGQFTSMQALTDSYRQRNALRLPVEAGTKVKFTAHNAGVLFTYDDPPAPNEEGVVVTARLGSSSGPSDTSYNDRVFVKFDDGKVRLICADHLTLAKGMTKRMAAQNRIRVASLDAVLGEFLKVAEDVLINKASRDLWSLKKDGTDFVIERLFDDQGDPLKA